MPAQPPLYVGEKEALAICRPYARIGTGTLRRWRAEFPQIFVTLPTYKRGRYLVPELIKLLTKFRNS